MNSKSSKIFENSDMVELAPAEIEAVSGGVIPLVAVGVAFGKGVAWGFGTAAVAHGTYKAYRFLTQ